MRQVQQIRLYFLGNPGDTRSLKSLIGYVGMQIESHFSATLYKHRQLCEGEASRHQPQTRLDLESEFEMASLSRTAPRRAVGTIWSWKQIQLALEFSSSLASIPGLTHPSIILLFTNHELCLRRRAMRAPQRAVHHYPRTRRRLATSINSTL